MLSGRLPSDLATGIRGTTLKLRINIDQLFTPSRYFVDTIEMVFSQSCQSQCFKCRKSYNYNDSINVVLTHLYGEPSVMSCPMQPSRAIFTESKPKIHLSLRPNIDEPIGPTGLAPAARSHEAGLSLIVLHAAITARLILLAPVKHLALRTAARARTSVPLLRLVAVLRDREDTAVFAAPFDAFVAVLVKRGEVFPELPVGRRDGVALAHRGEAQRQVAKRVGMKLVLVGLGGT